MNRRRLFKTALAVSTGAMVGGRDVAASPAPDTVPQVAYHLSDIDKVSFVLGNVRNHIDGSGDSDKVRIAIVVHGPPLRAFQIGTPNAAVRVDTARLVQAGVALFACVHRLEAMNLTPETLVPGFAVAAKGGVVKLAELQAAGWLYLRP